MIVIRRKVYLKDGKNFNDVTETHLEKEKQLAILMQTQLKQQPQKV